MSEAQVINDFLRRYLQDHAEGGVRPLVEYQSLFPGHEALIAEHYERCARRDDEEMPRTIGPFEVIREIGRGGQGVVYLAEDTRLRRRVALKVLSGAHALSPDALARLLREARVASRLDHPGICSVYEASVDAGVSYIAMQYVEGTTLAKRLVTTRERLTPGRSFQAPLTEAPHRVPEDRNGGPSQVLDLAAIRETVGLLEKAARSLHAAHESGIVHRDVKPGNIMVTPAGHAVVLDFGFAREEDSDLPTITRSGDFFGTPAYMSPEQLARERIRVDRRTDVWSLGVTLYEALALERPFEAPTREALHRAILTETPRDPRRINPAIPKDLRVVIETALEKDRDRRYQTAEAFANDLRAVLDHRPIAAKPIGPVGRIARWAAREPAKAALLVTALVAVPTISVLTALRIKDAPRIEAQRLADLEHEKDEHVMQGYFEMEEGNADGAIRLFEAATAKEGGSIEAAMGIVLALSHKGRHADALAALERYSGLLEGRRAGMALGRTCLEALGRETEADLDASLPAFRDPVDYHLEALRLLAEGHAGRGEAFAQALESCMGAILRSSSPRLTFFIQAAHAAGHARDRPALYTLVDALRRFWPQSAVAAFWRGVALGTAGDSDASINAFREAIRLKPDDFRAHHNLGNALQDKRCLDEAIEEYHQAIRLNPGYAWAYSSLGCALTDKGLIEEAFLARQQAVALDPRNALAQYNLGSSFSKKELLDEAIACFRKAIDLKPDESNPQQELAADVTWKGRLDEARIASQYTLKVAPGEATVHYQIGRLLKRQGKLDDAIEAYQRAIALKPDYADAHESLGIALTDLYVSKPDLMGKGLLDRAIHHHRRAIAIAGDDPFSYTNLGRALARQGLFAEAVASHRTATKLDPDFAEAYNNLAYALRANGQFEEALGAARKGHELGIKRADWHYPSADWVRELEALVAAERRMLSVASGKESPSGPADVLRLGDLAYQTRRWRLAAGWYATILDQDSERSDGLPLKAACAAVQAAGNGGTTSRNASAADSRAPSTTDATDAARLRQQALGWLVRHLRDLQEAAAGDELPKSLDPWLSDRLLAPVRDEPFLSQLPPEEARAWKEFWTEVTRLAR